MVDTDVAWRWVRTVTSTPDSWDLDTYEALFDRDVVWKSPAFEGTGAHVVRERFRELLEAIPDYTIREPGTVMMESEGHQVAFEAVQTGTIVRQLRGRSETILPSSEKFALDTVIIAAFNPAGLVTKVRMYFDLSGIDRLPRSEDATA